MVDKTRDYNGCKKITNNIFNDLYLCSEMLNETREPTMVLAKKITFLVSTTMLSKEKNMRNFDNFCKYWPYSSFVKTLPPH